MAISYSTAVDIRGVAVEPILEEVLFANKTIADSYVTFNTDIKAGTIFTEAGVDVTAQLYTGSAFITSLDREGSTEENVTFKVSFEGTGALTESTKS